MVPRKEQRNHTSRKRNGKYPSVVISLYLILEMEKQLFTNAHDGWGETDQLQVGECRQTVSDVGTFNTIQLYTLYYCIQCLYISVIIYCTIKKKIKTPNQALYDIEGADPQDMTIRNWVVHSCENSAVGHIIEVLFGTACIQIYLWTYKWSI